MKLSDLGEYQVQEMAKPGFSIDQRAVSNSPVREAQSNLMTSQKYLDMAKVFTSPLHTIAAGGDVGAGPRGAIKDSISQFASAGAQNAGPIGADMLAHSPAMQQGMQGLKDFTAPANTAEAVGAGQNTALQLGLGLAGLVSAGRKMAGAVGDFVRGKSGTRPLADVLNTPEDQVAKLSPIERKAFFDNQKQMLDKKYTQMEETLAKQTADKQAALQKESEDLLRQAQVSSRDETLAIRPKVIKAMGEQSSEYRKLVEEELAPVKDNPVNAEDLAKFIQTKYATDMEYGNAITQRIGLKPGDTQGTIGSIFERMKGLGQDMSATAKKGSRVFTPDEKLTDDAINTLTDYMKSQGVDLSKARQFWAQYAPVRNQMVNTIRPFNQAGTETSGFAKMLTKVAQGKDVNNENFMTAVQDLLGEPIGNDTKAAVAALGDNEKAKLAAELEAKIQQDAIDMAKSKDVASLSEREFEAERIARRRKIIKTILSGLLLYGADKKIKEKTGIGF